MYYITLIEPPSGVYQSQVIDVVNKLNELGTEPVRLVAFIPVKGFKKNKGKIKRTAPGALVFPLIFGTAKWQWHKVFFPFLLSRNRTMIGRGPLITSLGLRYFKKVIYDGRAALKAEIEEYDITGNTAMNNQIIEAERLSVLQADFRLAVSSRLVDYWKKTYGYKDNKHVIIPCTLTSQTENPVFAQKNTEKVKIVYSGGTGGWQSFGLVVKLLREALQNQKNLEAVFLTKETPEITALTNEFPERVSRKWLKHEEVFDELKSCDYGILIRDDKWTNRVASPVKFAEYLNAGLQVLLSPHIGDFSEFAQEHNVGIIIEEKIPELPPLDNREKERIHRVACENFLKSTPEIEFKYKQLLKQATNR